MRTVAVIGSARLSPPDPRCGPAEQIGAAIAAEGWAVMSPIWILGQQVNAKNNLPAGADPFYPVKEAAN